jgi:Carboxypeptidase regulatory-like domain
MSLQPGDTGLRTAFLVLPLMLAATLLGQNGFGVITGTVFDPLGAPFSDAEVQAKSASTDVVYRTISGSKGEYSITGIVPGTYTLTVLVRGTPMYTQANTILEASKALRLDVRMKETNALGAIGDNLLAFAE